MRAELVKTFQFEAAHITPWEGDPLRLHGHSFRVDIVVEGLCDANLGWVMDYGEISRRFDDLHRALDHRTLNNVEGISEPTTAGVRKWLEKRLADRIEGFREARVSIVGDQVFAPKLLHADSGQELPERVRFGFEAAHALPNLPEHHKCRRMHGHSFTVEVAARHNDILVPRLQDVYDRIDHRCLNEVDGLYNPTSEVLSQWIWNELDGSNELKAVVVAETCTAKCVYYGE